MFLAGFIKNYFLCKTVLYDTGVSPITRSCHIAGGGTDKNEGGDDSVTRGQNVTFGHCRQKAPSIMKF